MTDRPAVVIYGALSKASDDPDQTSIESQVAAVRVRLGQITLAGSTCWASSATTATPGARAAGGQGYKPPSTPLSQRLRRTARRSCGQHICPLWTCHQPPRRGPCRRRTVLRAAPARVTTRPPARFMRNRG